MHLRLGQSAQTPTTKRLPARCAGSQRTFERRHVLVEVRGDGRLASHIAGLESGVCQRCLTQLYTAVPLRGGERQYWPVLAQMPLSQAGNDRA